MDTIALVGNPNSGKTTLFNALTGEHRKTGNYAGVTVSRDAGVMRSPHGVEMELVDLPGCYSLSPKAEDERITRDALLGALGEKVPDLVLCVVDASNLERHLYLVTQVMDLGLPVVIALNKLDVAEGQGTRLDAAKLSDALGVPVVPCQANAGKGIVQLKHAMVRPFPPVVRRHWQGRKETEVAIKELEKVFSQRAPEQSTGGHESAAEARAILALADPDFRASAAQDNALQAACLRVAEGASVAGRTVEEDISQSRSSRVAEICRLSAQRLDGRSLSLTDSIDKVLLHPVFGWLFFIMAMFGVFWVIFAWAEVPMGWVESFFGMIENSVDGWMPDGDLKDLIVQGVVGGVGGVVIFLPQILLLLFFIGIMESTGYMGRAAFLMDGLMSRVGLNGKAFVPLLSSYACAIPGIMATRSIDNARQRLVTILIAPWMSCTARLPVYALLIGMLMASQGSFAQALVLAAIYVVGTLSAFLVAWILNKGMAKEEDDNQFMLELPNYTMPNFIDIFRHLAQRAFAFLYKAGTLILGVSILLWALTTYPKPQEGTPAAEDAALALEQSYMGKIGHVIEPAVKPLGYDWRTGTALMTAFAAREVFNASLAISYSVDADDYEQDEAFLAALRGKIANATWPDGQKIYTTATILSLIVFFIYALQCLPTTAVVQRETGSWKWALGQLVGMTVVAWLAAFVVYQSVSLVS